MLMITKNTIQTVDYWSIFEIACCRHILNDPVGLDAAIASSRGKHTNNYDYYVWKNTMRLL